MTEVRREKDKQFFYLDKKIIMVCYYCDEENVSDSHFTTCKLSKDKNNKNYCYLRDHDYHQNIFFKEEMNNTNFKNSIYYAKFK